MSGQTKQRVLVSAIVVVAVVLDQLLKVYIKTHFMLGEARPITSWFWLCFVENNGMAFGIEWFSKLALTLFRIVVVGLIGWYVHILIKRQQEGQKIRTGYLICLACVIAGALGNIIDCVFYGKIWGYAGWFYGKVVDMFYFPLIHNSAGEVIFFRPVFNLADSFITCAVIVLLIFYHRDLNESLNSLERKKKKSGEA
ncbi:MAG: signal peptidase II [Paludibacteraceae bacterium]